jgi:hypothetical protein
MPKANNKANNKSPAQFVELCKRLGADADSFSAWLKGKGASVPIEGLRKMFEKPESLQAPKGASEKAMFGLLKIALMWYANSLIRRQQYEQDLETLNKKCDEQL